MPHIRVSCNDTNYKEGFEQLLIADGVYAAWLGHSAPDTIPRVSKTFAGHTVSLDQRAHAAYTRIRVGDTLVMAGATGFYLGRVLAAAEQEIAAEGTTVGTSVRARVRHFARASQQRKIADRLAGNAGTEVYEVRFRVAWEQIVPTEAQRAWAKGVRGTFVHRTVPFPV
jgi:hypothetical protein